jgi:hypothetical protein
VIGDAVVKVLRDPDALQDRSNLFVAFKLTPLHSIKSLSVEFNWPYSASKLLPQDVPVSIKRRVAPTSVRPPLGVRLYKLVTDVVPTGHPTLSYRFAWKDAQTGRGLADNHVKRLESIKSLGEAENDDSNGINTPKLRGRTIRMTFNRSSRSRLHSIDPEEFNSPLSMVGSARKIGQSQPKKPSGLSAFSFGTADQRPAKPISKSPPK